LTNFECKSLLMIPMTVRSYPVMIHKDPIHHFDNCSHFSVEFLSDDSQDSQVDQSEDPQ
jgi:hypothetical protein